DHGLLEDFAARFDARLGVSEATGYAGFASALGQAQIARDRGDHTAERGTVTRIGDLAGGGVLAALDGPHARALAAAQLSPLTAHDAEHGTALVATLRAWLDADCSHEACARMLGVHRHTVRARLALTQRLLERDLASFGV